jgi:hypothetical protein
MRFRAIAVSVATVGLMVGPAFLHGIVSSVPAQRRSARYRHGCR